MSDENTVKQLGAQVRTMQMMVFALCTGVLSFGGYVLFAGGNEQPAQSNTLTTAAICFSVLGGVFALAVPALIAASQHKKIADGTWKPTNRQSPAPPDDVGKLLATYQLKIIIRAAFFEGPSFLALLAYMTEGHLVNLGLAAVMLIGLLAQFPTVGRAERWLEVQLERIEERRQFAS